MIIEEQIRTELTGYVDDEILVNIISTFKKFNQFMIEKHCLKTETDVQLMADDFMSKNQNIDEVMEKLFEKNDIESPDVDIINLSVDAIVNETHKTMFDFVKKQNYSDEKNMGETILLYIEVMSKINYINT